MNDALPSGFDKELGIEWFDLDPADARARIAVDERHLQPLGIVHGGVCASLAESICSIATYKAVAEDGMIAIGQSNSTTFVRAVSGGHLNAVARARHMGRTTWVWDVEISDDEQRLCTMARMTIAVRPRRPG